MLVSLVQRTVSDQLGFDLAVSGKRLGFRRPEAARGFALRQREIVDPILGHDARSRRCDACAHAHHLSIVPAGHLILTFASNHSVVRRIECRPCPPTSTFSASAEPSWAVSPPLRRRPAIASLAATRTSTPP